MGWKEKVKAARLPEVEEDVVTDGALLAEHDALREQLDKPAPKGAGSLAGTGNAELEERIREIEREMQDSVVKVRMRTLPRAKRPDDKRIIWRELTEQHPPRVSDEGIMDAKDRLAGSVNADTFPDAMVKASIVLLDGEEVSDSERADFLEILTQGQFDRLVSLCWALNKGSVNVPFYSPDSERT